MVPTLETYTTGFHWNSFGHHWHVWAPNEETIDAFGLQMWNHWHVWIPKVETIDAFGFRISTVKVTFAKLSPAQFQQQFSSAGLSLVLLSALDHPPNHPPTRDSSFTQSLARIYHWSTCESWSTTRWHLFDLIHNCPGLNFAKVSLAAKKISVNDFILKKKFERKR